MVKPLDLQHNSLPLPHSPIVLNNPTRNDQPKNLDLMGCVGDLGLPLLRVSVTSLHLLFYTCRSPDFSLPYACLSGFWSLECRVEWHCLEGPALELGQATKVNRTHRQCSSPRVIVQPLIFSMHSYASFLR
jgi:hypothetical protein